MCLLLWTGLLLFVGSRPAQAQIYKLPHPDTTRGTFFGVSVAIDGQRALVGASSEAACGPDSGAAYIFEYEPETDEWMQAARLVASDCTEGTYFGRTLDLSGDRAVIAASREFFSIGQANAVYVFERDSLTGTWAEVSKLQASPGVVEGAFASSVSLDGDRLLVTTSGDASDGKYHGAAYVFDRDPETGRWQRTTRLTGRRPVRYGIFGGTGDLDGDRIAVAASTYFAEKPGSIYLFERDAATGRWEEAAHFGEIADFFISLDLDGDQVLVGQSKGGSKKAGEALLYMRDPDGDWRRAEVLNPPTPYAFGAFGTLVSLDDGGALIAGYDEQLRLDFNIDRVVYVYRFDSEAGGWQYHRIYDIGEVAFGTSIDHDGSFGIIGQAAEQHAGAAYIVRL